MKQSLRKSFSRLKHSIWLVGLMLVLLPEVGWGQVSITPSRTDVSGFSTWSDVNVTGSNYLQLLSSTSTTISPAMDFDAYTNEKLNFKARTFGGVNATRNIITISISTDNGSSWTTLGTRTPGSTSLVAMSEFDLSSYSGTQVKVRFQTLGANGTIGAGIDDIGISGNAVPSIIAPALSSPTAINIDSTSATLGARIDNNGGDDITASGIAYGKMANPTTPIASSGALSGTFTVNVSNLASNTTYHYRGFATNSVGTGYSVDETFTTLPAAPIAEIPSVVAPNSFIASWNNVSGTEAETYQLDVSTDFSFNTSVVLSGQNTGSSTSFNVTGLAFGTTYYYRVRAVNDAGSGVYSNVVTVMTSNTAVLATVDVLAASAITANSAILNAEVLNNGGASVTGRGFYFGTSANPTANDTPAGSGIGAFNSLVTGLLPNTTYFYRAYAINSVGTAYSTDGTFTTVTNAPIAMTGTSITSSGFTANWNAVTGATSYRLDISESNSFSTFVTGFEDLNVGNVTDFVVTGLQSGTNYFYRVRAINASANASANSNTETITTSGPCIPKRIYFQGFEPNNNWPIVSASSGSISTATGSGDTPADQRILSGSKSWQTNNKTNEFVLTAVNVSNFTGKKIKIRLSSTSTTTGNGAETADYVKAYVALDGGSFPATADVTVTGVSNIRYGYNGTATVSTSAGTPVTVASSSSSNLTQQYSTIEITIPDNATSVSLKLEAKNDDRNEVWNVDDIEVMGCEIVNCSEPITAATNATVTPTATTAQLNWTNGSGNKRLVVVSRNVISAAELPADANFYTENAAYGTTGTAIGAGFVVFNGNLDNVLISNLLPGNTYHYAIVEYSCAPENYNITSLLSGSFTTLVTTLQFIKTTEIVNENDGTVSVDIVINNPSTIAPTTVQVALLTGSAADVNNYTTQTITFPAGSNANRTVTFTLTDDLVFKGSRLLAFGLQNAAGGYQAIVGTQNTFNLTIHDNELPEIYINEFHYNNAGADIDEFVEVVIPSSFNEFSDVTLTLYDGSNGMSYATYALSTFTTNDLSYGNYKIYSILIPTGIQDGNPDGFSIDYRGRLIEFISYGGSFVANNGPAQGNTSVDVGFTETESDPVGTSIYLTQGGSPWMWAKQTGSNTMGLPNTNQPLPVELLSFTAKAKENATVLTWETASEQNSSYFEIQRSHNAQTFETIGSAKAAGHSQTLKRYAFEDKNPFAGLAYYRLKQVDTDGTVAYSKIEQVNRKTGSLEMQLYPNPTAGEVTLILPEIAQAKIQVINILGQTVCTTQAQKTKELTLNLKHLPAGTYQVMVETENYRSVKKLVKTAH